MTDESRSTPRRFTFPKSHRLSGRIAFRLVFDGRTKASRGPLTVYARANDLGHPRFGLTVPRRVGNAVRRNAIKRHLREAYRHLRHDFPPLDLVIVVRPHRAMKSEEYRELLTKIVAKMRATVRGQATFPPQPTLHPEDASAEK